MRLDGSSRIHRLVGAMGLAILAALPGGALDAAGTDGKPWPPRRAGDAKTKADASSAVRVYVPNQMGSSVSVLDGEGELLTIVDLPALGFSEHAMPHQVAAEPDGSAWYVTLAGDGFVVKFDRDDRLVARVPFEAPGMIVLDPGRDRLYVSRALSAVSPPTSLGVFRASDLELLDELEVFLARPHGLAVDTVSGRVYTGSLASNQLAVTEPATGDVRVTAVAPAPNGFVGLATSPDGLRVVATTQLTDRLLVFDATDFSRLETVASVPVESTPYDVAFAPDGRSVWFPNQGADAVTRVDASDWTVTATIRHAAFVEPHGVVFSPDGREVYITSHGRALADTGGRANGTLARLHAATGRVVAVTEVGPYAAAPGVAAVP